METVTAYLRWRRCTYNSWCSFTDVDLSTIRDQGVYIVWHGGDNPRVVYIGQGDIVERIEAHRKDQDILKYQAEGGLYVTWARVSGDMRPDVECYLAERFQPLVGDRHPASEPPIDVNIPWDWTGFFRRQNGSTRFGRERLIRILWSRRRSGSLGPVGGARALRKAKPRRTGAMARNILRIGLADFDQIKARTMAIARGEHKPAADEPKIWFASIDGFAKVLSQGNRELLSLIAREKPDSLSSLASMSGRSKSTLSRTLKTMSQFGLVELEKGPRGRVVPRVPYRQVQLAFSLTETPWTAA